MATPRATRWPVSSVALEHLTDSSSRTSTSCARSCGSPSTPATTPTDLPLRQGRAIGWFEDALAPARDRLSAREIHRLALAIRAACGIEALVWLTDVGGLSREDAVELMRGSARTVAAAALAHRSAASRIARSSHRTRAKGPLS